MALNPLTSASPVAPDTLDPAMAAYGSAGALNEQGVSAHDDAQGQKQRLLKQAQAWRNRSRRIRRLRLVFPGLIIATLMAIVGWVIVQSVLNSLNVYQSSQDDIRMTNPRFFGQTTGGDRYIISGLEALRRGNNAAIISVNAPNMELKSDNSKPTLLKGLKGVYNEPDKTFTVEGDVVLNGGPNDFSFKTAEAIVDLNTSTVSGNKPIEGFGPTGHIKAQSYTIYDNGQRIVFHGKDGTQVRAVINPQ
ncbi:LPS export ABC transporter periplasmic protein LptC [Asticcacaulis machinosus]|uniref:LPS export ABC transporter periplasmic protein LptC n=1 Tax=Asticcacaulis machinosus TaxID=2984211 RepID=A0ABT5HK26_9CAUL|nr:LPS export ABC transporter periplasmic protein LptC [Asticcacaulis machinosus]MDC7676480.1 LPS export ABC transporter periplasmic protein LptC [Asticcacaulis machinosus]